MKFAKTLLFSLTLVISFAASANTMSFNNAPMAPIRSQIVGQFDGWSGDTVFKLSNGQWWQQVEPGVWNTYHAMNPYVVVYNSNGCQRLQVEGQPYSVCVKIVMH